MLPGAWKRSAIRIRSSRLLAGVSLLGLWALGSPPAFGYIGPGAGFAVLTSVFGLLVSLLFSFLALLAWPFRALLLLLRGRKAYGRSAVQRVILVGLDGLDPDLAQRYMGEGKLPNLSRMSAEGGFAPLATTTPPVSPVAWSSLATGTEPAKHNIFDFLARDPKSYFPALSSVLLEGPEKWLPLGRFRVPLSRPRIRGMRRSVPFWKLLGEHGIHSTILRLPITFPPDPFDGHLLSGMCVPDLQGSQGSSFFYTSQEGPSHPRNGGTTIRVTVRGDLVETCLPGPGNDFLRGSPAVRLPMKIRMSADGSAAQLQIGNQQFELRTGIFSPWIRLRFPRPPGLAARGMARFLLRSRQPHFELYVTPIHLDPERPAMPISVPSYYSSCLARLIGPFATLGMANDTWALNEGILSEQEFLDQAYDFHREWERIFFLALDRVRRGVVACHFETPDAVQHMFFRHLPPGPAAGPGRPEVIEELYRRMDDLVGRLRQKQRPGDWILVLSDHGFKPFRRSVNLNAWLAAQGYLALRAGGPAKAEEWFAGVDWPKTKAYSLGLTGIFLNLRGREPMGAVEPGGEAVQLVREIAGRLEGLRDEERGGCPVVRRAIRREERTAGPYLENGPELIVGYNAGYRTSWESAKGIAARPILEENRRVWSGDHCIDPEEVPGVFFSSKPFDCAAPRIWDIAPTILQLFGIAPPGHMDGKPFPVEGDASGTAAAGAA